MCQRGFQIAYLVLQRMLVQFRSVELPVRTFENFYLLLYLLSSMYPVLLLQTGL